MNVTRAPVCFGVTSEPKQTKLVADAKAAGAVSLMAVFVALAVRLTKCQPLIGVPVDV